MTHTSFTLNGTWEMFYCEEKYLSSKMPFEYINNKIVDAAGTEPEDASTNVIENAVPGYWEDMTDKFRYAPFFGSLKVNPEYGLQSYPISGTAPDMALPNIVGNFFYKRSFYCKDINNSAAIRFDGVQNSVSLWVNGKFLGRHEGYSAPFEIALPDNILENGENTIVMSVSNHPMEGYEGELISGLANRAANQYTGGITGNVELIVYNSPLRDVKTFVSHDCKKLTVKPELTQKAPFDWALCDGDELIKWGSCDGDFELDTENLLYWSPENPKLYKLKITCGDAVLERNIGIRRLVPDGVHFKLNNTPYYLRGICEHCYFPETVHPAHDYEYYSKVIKEIKKLGFNYIRFHTFVPEEEYMRAADELGVLLHVECPNNTTVSQWREIVDFCSKHTSVVIYCCGNELLMDEPFIEHLNKCGDIVHENTDALFSPMSAMRGLEYYWVEADQEGEIKHEPFKHHPRRISEVSKFSDMYSSYANGLHSYFSLDNNPDVIDDWSRVYNKPRVSHEICIDGTYTDLSVKNRYKNSRIGKTEMFSSIEKHLEEKGVLDKAPVYFKNSSQWQRRVRKYCFESIRLSKNMAGYDFLGPIDTHWHTFGYDVGMMNEFYELKPGETVENVLRYNSPTVLLTNLGKRANFECGDTLNFSVITSHYGKDDIKNVQLSVSLFVDGDIAETENVVIANVTNGQVSELGTFSFLLPNAEKPKKMLLSASLKGEGVFAENEWELYLFPKVSYKMPKDVIVKESITEDELCRLLSEGRDVVLMGDLPFETLPTSFRISLAGRTTGNLATVVNNHPATNDMPHEGFCGWQFAEMMDGGNAVCFETDAVPFNPVVEVASTHKYVIKQASLFEFKVETGRLLVCGFNFKKDDAGANWFKNKLISYAGSAEFNPENTITADQLKQLMNVKVRKRALNTNFACNANDKTAVRKNKKGEIL